jgi:hypothetical protein
MTVLLHSNPMATKGQPGSPHFYRQRLDEKVASATTTTKPIHFVNDAHIRLAMRVPEHFTPQTTPTTLTSAATDLRDSCNPANLESDASYDAKSDVSSLQCGSVPMNPKYNPALDPHLLPPQSFVPPTEITVRLKVEIQELLEEDQGQERVRSTPPEWLKLPDLKQDSKNKQNKSKLSVLGDGREQNDDGPRHRRISSLTSSAKRIKKTPALRRSFSEDSFSLPSYALKPGTTLLLEDSTWEDPLEILSPSFMPCRDTTWKKAEQLEKEQEHVVYNVLSPIDSNWEQHEQVGHVMGPSYSYSFSDSYETSLTIYDSSSEPLEAVAQMGTEPGSMTLLQAVPGSSEHTTSHQPRKGMVRREFQRRFLWFRKSNITNQPNQPPSDRLKGSNNKSKRKDKTLTPLSTQWKQSPNSCMV